MFLITGANGKTGHVVIGALLAKGKSVRALVHRQEQVQAIRDMGVDDVHVGDMLDQDTLNTAYMGMKAVYHICPAAHPDEEIMGTKAINAAIYANTEHFVYHSVLHSQIDELPHHKHKLQVENQLINSGLHYTIIQPTIYMQNLLDIWEIVVRNGLYPIPYSKETRLAMVDLKDVADVVALVLTEKGHIGATYELCGSEILSLMDIASTLSKHVGSEVKAESISVEAWGAHARANGLSEYEIDILSKMFKYYDTYGFLGNSNVLTWLLSRSPTNFEAFVQRTITK